MYTCTYGVAVAVWVFGVSLLYRCVGKRGYCVGKSLLDNCAGAYPGGGGGGGVQFAYGSI